MKRIKFKVSKMTRKKLHIFFNSIIAVLWIISTWLTIQALRKPLVLEEAVITNRLEEKVSYDYMVDVKRSLLYPKGGKVSPDGIIFNNITNSLIITLDYGLKSEKSVKVEGNIIVKYRITATDMWEREFVIIENKPIKSEGVENSLLKEDIAIDLSDLLEYTTKIEEATLVKPNSYTLTIEPQIKGTVYQDNNQMLYKVDKNLEIPFELNSQTMKYKGDPQAKEQVYNSDIQEINTVPVTINLFNNEVLLLNARYIFGILSFVLFLILIPAMYKKLKIKKVKVSEINLIDKKHKGKIIEVNDRISYERLPRVGLKSFKDLFSMAEEKEEPILKYNDDKDNSVYYYFPCVSCIYFYSVSDNVIAEGQ
jgi:hypothetical protein